MIIALVHLNGCAGPQPGLYRNAHLRYVLPDRSDEVIAECEELAEEYATKSEAGEKVANQTALGGTVGAAGGAVGGAISGNVGLGAAIGAAIGATQGLLLGLFGASSSDPSPTYKKFVNRCLHERGYEPIGWD